LAAVDDDGFAGEVGTEFRRQINHCAGHIRRRTFAPEWDTAAYGSAHVGWGIDVVEAGINQARRHTIDADMMGGQFFG